MFVTTHSPTFAASARVERLTVLARDEDRRPVARLPRDFGLGDKQLAYLWRLPRLVASDVPGARRMRGAAATVGGSALRWSVTVAGLAGGLVFAMLAAHLSSAWR